VVPEVGWRSRDDQCNPGHPGEEDPVPGGGVRWAARAVDLDAEVAEIDFITFACQGRLVRSASG